jgi:hypothetical protein
MSEVTTICTKCKHHVFYGGVDDRAWSIRSPTYRCNSPSVGPEPELDYVTGKDMLAEIPLCSTINTRGQCEHYEAK